MTTNIQKFTLANLHNETFAPLSQALQDTHWWLPAKISGIVANKYIKDIFHNAASENSNDLHYASLNALIKAFLPLTIGTASLIPAADSYFNTILPLIETPTQYGVTLTVAAIGLGTGIKYISDFCKYAHQDNKLCHQLETHGLEFLDNEQVYKKALEAIKRHTNDIKKSTPKLASLIS